MSARAEAILTGKIAAVPVLGISDFQRRVSELLHDGGRLAAFFGSPAPKGAPEGEVCLNAVIVPGSGGRLVFLRSSLRADAGYHSMTPELPLFHCFERECHEQFGVIPHGHPWLKPIRFPKSEGKPEGYRFFKVEGKEVHEVGVGPIHAGVIEPGHFRFMCYGETVEHLEIQLGYQHRGAEKLLLRGNPGRLAPLVETISGDSSIAHAWAYCSAWEALCGFSGKWELNLARGIALELERVAMHLAGLSGLATDIGFLPGSSTYGRLRTAAINTSMKLCGSRFGRGWLRPGEARSDFGAEALEKVRAALSGLQSDIRAVNELFESSAIVRHRLQSTGRVSFETAKEMGFVGMAARSAGHGLDLRVRFPGELYSRLPVSIVTENSGDCWARALLRIREIDESLKWLFSAQDEISAARIEASSKVVLEVAAKESFAISMVEGWRGEVLHYLETDSSGMLRHYRVQDPSLRNWFALALAVRNNGISDFPICNKSFDLSYCGNDL